MSLDSSPQNVTDIVGVIEVISAIAYKIACVTAGTIIARYGYQLFKENIWGSAAKEVRFQHLGFKLIFRNAAPGTFFAVLGAAIVVWTISEKVNIGHQQQISERTMSCAQGESCAPMGGTTMAPSSVTLPVLRP